MVNTELKSQVLSIGLNATVRKVNRAFFKDYYSIPLNKNELSPLQAKLIFDEWHKTQEGAQLWHIASKINNNNYHRIKRLKARITNLLAGPCVFLTLTFTDEFLANTSPQTRRRYVCRFLSQYGDYVGNIDFGKKNKREHYHAILRTDDIVKYSSWCGGSCNGKKITVKNSDALARYIAKLTNHAIKETTKSSRIIYSR